MRQTLFTVLLASTFGLAATPALASDRPPTEAERTAIEKVLREQGYVSWEEIEFDDGRWEVDDARTRNGLEYDLKLDPRTLAIIKRVHDD